MAAERAAGPVDDRARPLAHAAVTGEEGALAGPGEEAEVLRLALVGDGQPGLARELAHLRLAQLAEREAHPRHRLRRERGQHVALVLGRVGRRAQQPVRRDARVVAGREVGRAEPVGERQHRVEPHVAVAAHARVRREAGGVVGEERRHHALRERGAQVEREVRHAHTVRDRAREPDGVRRAARRLGVVGRIAPQLERDGDGLASGLLHKQRGDRRVDAAAHRHERARGVEQGRRSGRVKRRARGRRAARAESRAGGDGGAERHVQRVGRELGRVQLARATARPARRTPPRRRSARRRARARRAAARPPPSPPRPPRRSPTPRSRRPPRGRPRPSGRCAPDRRTPRRRRCRRTTPGARGRAPGETRDARRRPRRPRRRV